MFHLAAFEEAIDNTADVDLDAVLDNILRIENSHFKFGRPINLGWAWAGSATLARGRIDCPSFRQITNPHLLPIEGAVLPADDPNVCDFMESPLELPAGEEIGVRLTSAVACGTEQSSALLGLYPSFRAAPRGNIHGLRFTSSTAAVARTWTQIAVAFEENVRSGIYAVVGGKIVSTNAIAFRLIFEDQQERPGALGYAAESTSPWPRQLKGGLGEWGRFHSDRMPNIEVYNNGTDNSHVGYLEIVRVG